MAYFGENACAAWVNFNGQGTVSIRDDYNISSITDHGSGDYTCNFSTNMSDSNYAVALAVKNSTNHQTSGASREMIRMTGSSGYSSSGFRIINSNVMAQAAYDVVIFCAVVFADS